MHDTGYSTPTQTDKLTQDLNERMHSPAQTPSLSDINVSRRSQTASQHRVFDKHRTPIQPQFNGLHGSQI